MLVQRLYCAPPRLPVLGGLLLSMLTQMLCWASPAQSQGFFQQLFGLSPAPQYNAAPRPVAPRQPVGGAPMRIGAPQAGTADREAPRSVAPEGSGSYTTMCVRMCDGFFFPISHRVQRSRFHRDADACRSRCGASESRLFYHSTGSDMQSAVDLTGRSYARLPIAFRHRKQLVSGCSCRPEPWSVEAQIRHEGYALAAGHSVPGGGRSTGSFAVVAGNYPDVPSSVSVGSEVQAGREQASSAEAGGAEPAGGVVASATGPGASLDAPPVRDASAAAASVSPVQPHRSKAVEANGRRQKATTRAPQTAKPANVAAAPRKPTRIASATPPPANNKLVWPGDAPTR